MGPAAIWLPVGHMDALASERGPLAQTVTICPLCPPSPCSQPSPVHSARISEACDGHVVSDMKPSPTFPEMVEITGMEITGGGCIQ